MEYGIDTKRLIDDLMKIGVKVTKLDTHEQLDHCIVLEIEGYYVRPSEVFIYGGITKSADSVV